MKLLSRIVVAVLACGPMCLVARATVIFDNLGNENNGFADVYSGSMEAQRFNSDASDVVLSAVTLNLYVFPPANYTLSLYSDLDDHPNSSVATLFSGNNGLNGDVTFSGLSAVMSSSTNYWLVLSVATSDPTVVGWGVTLDFTGTGSGFQTASEISTDEGLSWSARGVPHQALIVERGLLPGDVNNDGVVNGLDISLIASHWLQSGAGVVGDANSDGVVNGLDISVVASHWLQTGGGGAGSGTAVPEPTTLVLAALGGLTSLICRRRRPQCRRFPSPVVAGCDGSHTGHRADPTRRTFRLRIPFRQASQFDGQNRTTRLLGGPPTEPLGLRRPRRCTRRAWLWPTIESRGSQLSERLRSNE
jgi:hypothetical protein